MSLPINHLKKTLDRCCGHWEFVNDPCTHRYSVRFLNTRVEYLIRYESGKWSASRWDKSGEDAFLTNRLNGLTRDDAGNVQRTDSEGRDVTGLTGLHDESDWQVWRKPTPDFVLQDGDEYRAGGAWHRCTDSVGRQVKDVFTITPALQIRRRIQPALPADFACVPEASDEFEVGDWVVCVGDSECSGISIGDVLQVSDLDAWDDPGFDLPRGKSFYLACRFRHARPDEIETAAREAEFAGTATPEQLKVIGLTPADAQPPMNWTDEQLANWENGETVIVEPIQLREGAWYERRDGNVVGPAKYECPGQWQGWKVGEWWYIRSGRFNGGVDHDYDLIREVQPRQLEPDSDGWIAWHGGECPTLSYVEVRLRSGAAVRKNCNPMELRWSHTGFAGDITHYRIVQPDPLATVVSYDKPAIEKQYHEVLQMISDEMQLIEDNYDRSEQPAGYSPEHTASMCALMRLRNRILDKWLQEPCGVEVSE